MTLWLVDVGVEYTWGRGGGLGVKERDSERAMDGWSAKVNPSSACRNWWHSDCETWSHYTVLGGWALSKPARWQHWDIHTAHADTVAQINWSGQARVCWFQGWIQDNTAWFFFFFFTTKQNVSSVKATLVCSLTSLNLVFILTKHPRVCASQRHRLFTQQIFCWNAARNVHKGTSANSRKHSIQVSLIRWGSSIHNTRTVKLSDVKVSGTFENHKHLCDLRKTAK